VQGTLLVRMIKPNLICSHNWHVQPSFQRSVRALRLSGALLDRGPWLLRQECPRTCALGQTALFSALGRFCANFLNLSKFLLYVKLLFSPFSVAVQPHREGGFPASKDRTGRAASPFDSASFAQAQIFQTATSIARATRARGNWFPGLAMACSLKDYLQGSRGFIPTSPDPTNQLPTSHSGQAQRPPGGSIA